MAQIKFNFTSSGNHQGDSSLTFLCDNGDAFIAYLRDKQPAVANEIFTNKNDFRRFLVVFLNESRIYSVDDIDFTCDHVSLEVLPSISGG